MSSYSTQIDHNYYEMDSEDVLMDEDIDVEDIPDLDIEDIPDLVDLCDNYTDFNPLYLNLLETFSPEENKVLHLMEGQELDTTVTKVLDNGRQSGGNSCVNSLNSSSSSSVSISRSKAAENKWKTSKNKKKKPIPGKQLRNLFKLFGVRVNTKASNEVKISEAVGCLRKEIMTRSRTNCEVNRAEDQRHRSVDIKSVNKYRINDQKCDNSKKNGRKLITTITRIDANEDSATVSPESHIDSEFVHKLCKFWEQMKRNKYKSLKNVTESQFRPFLPVVRIEKLRNEPQICIKQPKNLKKSKYSLLNNKYDVKRDLKDSQLSAPPVSTSYKQKNGTLLRKSKRLEIPFKPLERLRKDCKECKAAKPKTYPRLMSRYLRTTFRKPKKRLKCPLRVKLSKHWSRGVDLRLEILK